MTPAAAASAILAAVDEGDIPAVTGLLETLSPADSDTAFQMALNVVLAEAAMREGRNA